MKTTRGTVEEMIASLNEVVGRIGGDYHWHISENAVFSETVATTIGSDNTYIDSLTELKAGIIGDIALVLGYLVFGTFPDTWSLVGMGLIVASGAQLGVLAALLPYALLALTV